MEITTRLKVLRVERGLSQMAVAQHAGISHNRYWRIENGYTDPSDQDLAGLASDAVLGPSVRALFRATRNAGSGGAVSKASRSRSVASRNKRSRSLTAR